MLSRIIDITGGIAHYKRMSLRSWTTEALVLSLSSFGEGHREAALLTPSHGIVRAAVFGGAKSKLKSLVSPWHAGTAWLYSDPVRKTVKVTDFDVVSFRQGLRENLVRSWCASLCTEIVTRGQGTADWRLVNGFLDGIAVSDEDACRLALLRYVWRTLGEAGLSPDLSQCSRCGIPLGGANGENEVSCYLPHEDALACGPCSRDENQRFALSAEALRYLGSVDSLKPSESRALALDSGPRAELRDFLFFLLARMVDGRLKTIESGEGIL